MPTTQPIAQCRCHVTHARQVRTKIVPSNPLKSDPTRTKTLRKKFERAISKRASKLAGLIVDLIVEEDAFGLKQTQNAERNHGLFRNRGVSEPGAYEGPPSGSRNRLCDNDDRIRNRTCDTVLLNQRFSFQTAPEQLASFERWVAEQQGVRFGDRADPYWEEFIQEGYEKGAGRAFDDTNRARRALAQTSEDIEFLRGSKEQFLRDAFAQPETREKISLLASRTFGDLRAVDGQTAALLNRTLSAGLAQGMNPRAIARTMLEGTGLNRDRAQVIARTEIIRAHAEGQLDAMERMGVEKVGVMVEWSTAGDDRVCPLCQPLDGVVMKLSEARGLIPRHPQCRCAHVPAQVGEPADVTRRVNFGDGPQLIRQRKSKAEIEAAFRRSVGAERKKGTLKEKRRRSRWQGADRTIAKKRPKSILETGVSRTKARSSKITPKAPVRVTRPGPSLPVVPRAATPKPIRDKFSTKTKIGSGNTGDVFRLEDTVIKSARFSDGVLTKEGEVYKQLAGGKGIAAGKQVGEEIHTPFFKDIVSVDDVERKSRKNLGPFIAKSREEIHEAITALSEAGYDYGDVLQFGVGDNRKLQLLDFSGAVQVGPEEAARRNFNHLRNFYHEFGLQGEAKRLGLVSDAISGIGTIVDDGIDMLDWIDEAIQPHAKQLLSQLDNQKPRFAYYSTNGRHIGIADIAQTEPIDKVKVILTRRPLTAKEIVDWEIVPVQHTSRLPQATTPKISRVKATPRTVSPTDIQTTRTLKPVKKVDRRSKLGRQIIEEAEEFGIAPEDLRDAVDLVHGDRVGIARTAEGAKQSAHRITDLTSAKIRELENLGFDHASGQNIKIKGGEAVRQFDVRAVEVARQHPELGLSDPSEIGVDIPAELWDILREPRVRIPQKTDSDILREAADYVTRVNGSRASVTSIGDDAFDSFDAFVTETPF